MGDAERRRCVACGYTDQRPAAAAVEPSTRLSRASRGPATETPVRILGEDDPSTERTATAAPCRTAQNPLWIMHANRAKALKTFGPDGC